MAESHASMRDDLQITVPAIDQLLEVLQQGIVGDSGDQQGGLSRRRAGGSPALA